MSAHPAARPAAHPTRAAGPDAPASAGEGLAAQLAAAWRLVRPFWTSEARWPARGLLLLIILIDMARAYAAVRMTYWHRDFLDALTAYDMAAFKTQLWVFVLVAGPGIFLDTARPWFNQKLEMRWRAWMTGTYLDRWLAGTAYYRMERERLIDNPDQRIAEDLRLMASETLRLSLGLLDNVVKLVSYSAVVWTLSGSLSFAIGGHAFVIPGYMLWAAVLYALAGSVLQERIGKPLVAVDYQQQRQEAQFRFLMVRLRENAEQVAFYRGTRTERTRLAQAFDGIQHNWRDVMRYTKRITFLRFSYIEVGAFIPYLLIVPRYFAKEITLGMVQQLTLAFSRARQSLSWFIFTYKDLALLRSVFRRLHEFDSALGTRASQGILMEMGSDSTLRVQALRVHHADGQPLAAIDALDIAPGQRWLVRGRSGVGKSTVLRALAGLWGHGSGVIIWPDKGQVMFVPQLSYLPMGSLRACLSYPSEEGRFSTDEYLDALQSVQLSALASQLDEDGNWAKHFSPGEQQRLAFARVLLQRPSYLFLDEATASLDGEAQACVYRAITDRLPNLALLSVGHRDSLRQWHTHECDLGEGEPQNWADRDGRLADAYGDRAAVSEPRN